MTKSWQHTFLTQSVEQSSVQSDANKFKYDQHAATSLPCKVLQVHYN